MNDIYNLKVYNLVSRELFGVKWDHCPYNIEQGFVQLALRYYPQIPIKQIEHDVKHAVANELCGGCELETI